MTPLAAADQLGGEVFDLLAGLGDFDAFKTTMLAQKARVGARPAAVAPAATASGGAAGADRRGGSGGCDLGLGISGMGIAGLSIAGAAVAKPRGAAAGAPRR